MVAKFGENTVKPLPNYTGGQPKPVMIQSSGLTPNVIGAQKLKAVASPNTTAPRMGLVGQGIKDKVSAATANLTSSVSAPTLQNKALQQFGGQDAYIKSQLERYTGGDAVLQGKINKDLERFGVKASPITGRPETPGFSANSLAGATIGNENGSTFFQLPDGSREWIDTPEELEIANQINTYNTEQEQIKAAQAAGLAQNQSDYNFATGQLASGEAVAKDAAQQLHNRRGGFYSGGLDYQTGGISREYGQQRGQLAQQFQAANQALLSKYGSQTEQIRNNINNLLSTAPGLIQQAIDKAAASKAEEAQKKKDANLQAALDFTKSTGYVVNPQEDYSGFYRQVQQGAPLTPDKQLDIAKFTEEQKQNLFDNNLNIQKFEEDKRQFGLDYAIKQNSQAISEDANLRQWAELDYKQSKGGAGSGEYAGLSPNQLYEAISSNYTVQDPTTKKNRITSDPAMREQMFLDAIDASAGMTDAQVTQLLTTLGLRRDEIEQFEKKHTPSGK